MSIDAGNIRSDTPSELSNSLYNDSMPRNKYGGSGIPAIDRWKMTTLFMGGATVDQVCAETGFSRVTVQKYRRKTFEVAIPRFIMNTDAWRSATPAGRGIWLELTLDLALQACNSSAAFSWVGRFGMSKDECLKHMGQLATVDGDLVKVWRPE